MNDDTYSLRVLSELSFDAGAGNYHEGQVAKAIETAHNEVSASALRRLHDSTLSAANPEIQELIHRVECGEAEPWEILDGIRRIIWARANKYSPIKGQP